MVRAEGIYGTRAERSDFARKARRHNDRATIAEQLDEGCTDCVNGCGRRWGHGPTGDLCVPCARREEELASK